MIPLVLVINLDRSRDRLDLISAQLGAAGLAFERIRGVDGSALNIQQPDNELKSLVDFTYWCRFHHRNLLKAEIGCYLSHIKAIDRFLASPAETALILEDDAEIPVTLAPLLRQLQAAAPHWDIVKLHARHPGPQLRRKTLGDDRWMTSFITDHTGATAYLINRQAAATLKNYLLPARLPYDYLLHRGFEHGLRVRGVTPMPIRPSQLASTIEAERVRPTHRKRTLLEKWADRPYAARWRIPFMRAWCEMRRVSYNVLVDGGLAAMLRGPS